jgi:hypothetical protein
MKLGIFVDGGLNNIDIGFSLSKTTPISSQFNVFIYIGANGVMENSINTNLPKLNATQG